MRTATLPFLLLFAASAFAQGAKLINGFNTDDDLKAFRWSKGVKTRIVEEHVTEGKGAVEITFPPDVKYRGFQVREPQLMGGWNRFDLVSFDVFNPGAKIVTLVIRIDDDLTDPADYSTWYTGTLKMFPGANHVDLEIAKLARPHDKGVLHADKLKQFVLWTKETPEPRVLVFDNFRLRRYDRMVLPLTLHAFDFGSTVSNVFGGFTLVTEKDRWDELKGYGFANTTSLLTFDDAPRAADPLTVDSVGSTGRFTFKVRLPDGKYRLWAATGYVDSYNYPRRAYTVKANGKVIFRHAPKTLNEREAADPVAREYRPGVDPWDLFVPGHLFDEFETEIVVDGRDLGITLDGEAYSNRLRALALWPVDDKDAAQAMADVQKRRRDAFHRQWREIVPPRIPEPQTVTDAETARGFILSAPNLCEEITPYYVPSRKERLHKLTLFAAKGQRAAATFVIWPLQDMKEVTVSSPDEQLKLGTVELCYVREGEDAFSVKPVQIVPRRTFPCYRHVPRQVWIEIDVADDAAPGVRRDTLTVKGPKGEVDVPLEITVYPFTLEDPAKHGYTYAHACSIRGDAAEVEADLRCLKRYGSNSVTPAQVIGGKMQGTGGKSDFDFSRLDLLMDVMKKVGMTGPVPLFDQSMQGYAGGRSRWHIGWQVVNPNSDWAANMTRLTAQVLARAKEKNYLPVLMYPSTEISNDPNLGPAFNARIIAAIRKAGDVKTISSVNTPPDVETAKLLDCIMINFGVDLTQQTLDRIHAAGAKLWFQNVGQTRYADGLFLLRAGAVGRRQWVAMWPSADPFSDWDGRESNSLIFPSKMGTLPSVHLAWMGEGVTDLRYFLTLKRAVADARKAGKTQAADAAQKEMDAMIASCPIALPDGARIMPDGLAVIDGFADQTTFDRYRRRVAELIIELQK